MPIDQKTLEDELKLAETEATTLFGKIKAGYAALPTFQKVLLALGVVFFVVITISLF